MKYNTIEALKIAKMMAAIGIDEISETTREEIGGVDVSLTPDPVTREGEPEQGELPS
jgi:hypothetical protein